MELFDMHYNGKAISYEFYKKNVMLNATEMAKVFGKRVENFTRNDQTKAFVKECLKNANSRFLNIGYEEDLINSKQNSGTWMHRVLALKFAAWLDPAFELWVYCMIDKILFEHYRQMEQNLKESAKRKNKMDSIRKKLRKNELYLELEQLELEERQAGYKRGKMNRTQVSVLRDALAEEEE